MLQSFIKSLLNIKELDLEDEAKLEQDVDSYSEIINSAKYADSNADTTTLEKLLKTMSMEGSTVNSEIKDAIKSAVLQNQETGPVQPSPPKAELPPNEANSVPLVFRDLLSRHLQCLDDLEQALPGQPPNKTSKFGKEGGSNFVLRQFRLPNYIYGAIERNDVRALKLNGQMTEQNYVNFFQTLIWIEEAHQSIEMHRYDLSDVLLGKFENFFSVMVPGLAEGRPSLMRGDKLLLKSGKRSTVYEGYIYEVREHDILIKLHERLHASSTDGLRFEVSFLSSRTPYRRCHHGILQLQERAGTSKIIFPRPREAIDMQPSLIEVDDDPMKFACYKKCLNIHQRKAIINALKGEARPAPYIIYGPPGTGKTVTLVETILQVYKHRVGSKILVCANSNACVDLLTERILEFNVVGEKELVRLSAFYRMENMIPPSLEKVTMDMDMISSEDYKHFRIVLTTCSQASALNDFNGKFDYVFVDEAGHATEPETLVAISLLKPDGCCVLAGDHQQLGPVCMSKIAESHGLGTSLLERLARRSVYQRQVRGNKMVYDERYLTKLIICYRCDPRVLAVNNRLFYDNELKFVTKTPAKWMQLFGLDNCLVFHSVKGRDRKEYLDPSWFNPNEGIRCLVYVKRLYEAGLRPDQLGIITPYRRQIEKLKLLFQSCGLRTCKIATMEEFQGDEREVIIISTVRTREKNLKVDKRFNLGFLFNPKRFNVAVSRAKWLVIAIGDPAILERDHCWTEYLKEAQRFEDAPSGQANGPRKVEL